ncbi:MAG: YedE-related selenium metabolism membrane protein [Nitrospiraceae bacterium]|nr:YedE-related selenium metabolism membrane protein [Nitrospiraceae bacterium]
MSTLTSFFGSRKGIVSVGLFIGAVAALLQKLGNPANMGICVACMERDIVGALGFHRDGVVQYIRPEIIGLVLGAMLAAFLFKEFKARTGSAPIVRFVLGFFAMVGALVFLGCPWRALLRLAGGDGNAIVGLLGLSAGIGAGSLFIKSGYSLGANKKTYSIVGFILPAIMIGLLLLLLFAPKLPTGTVFFSVKGPGSQHAAIFFSLILASAIGFFAQRTRFCTMGAIRDVILIKDFHLLSGIIALVIGAFVTNLIFNQFNPGFENQPIAHTDILWNFGGMVLAGIAFSLAGGCPGRQLFLSGEGDGDAAVFVIGMFSGAAFAHNFTAASTPAGPGLWGPASVIVGLIVCVIIGFAMREKIT